MSPVEPCAPWGTEVDLPETCDLEAVDPDNITAGWWQASTILYNLTGRRWPGLCQWTSIYHTDCGAFCASATTINLPASTRTIVSVTVGTETLDPSAYTLRDGQLVRLDGRRWPCSCDGLNDGTQVSFLWGADPPASAVRMAGRYAWEVALAFEGGDCANACRLPKDAETITRNGITVTRRTDVGEVLAAGRTGLPEVDSWLAAVRYGDTNAPAQIVVPGSRTRL